MSVFFFQAEDGIRDYKVTGVQTCALPICPLAVFDLVQLQLHGHLRLAVGVEGHGTGHAVVAYGADGLGHGLPVLGACRLERLQKDAGGVVGVLGVRALGVGIALGGIGAAHGVQPGAGLRVGRADDGAV